MAEQTLQWRFRRGDATSDEIRETVDEILAQLSDPDSDASAAARAAGLDPATVRDATIDVREDRQGAEPVLTAILIGIAVKAGSAVAESLWKAVIWPRL